jgi:transcriptional regulator with XRE-family HTH domain
VSILSDKLLRARKRINQTQKQIAATVGVTAAYIHEVEHGTRKASRETAPRLARALNMRAEIILFHLGIIDVKGYEDLPDEAIVLAYTTFYQVLARAKQEQQAENQSADLLVRG